LVADRKANWALRQVLPLDVLLFMLGCFDCEGASVSVYSCACEKVFFMRFLKGSNLKKIMIKYLNTIPIN
jgi:hypothetical protein